MKKHTKIYFDFFKISYDESGWHDYIRCEKCGAKAVDIHHIDSRKMGGNKNKDYIENLMALCRQCHQNYGDINFFKSNLQKIHNEKIRTFKGDL